jgi:hypothetical protein
MVSLNTAVSRHRVFYPRPVAPMPDILMIDLSAGLPDAAGSFRRFHPILCETVSEQQELEAYLDEERDGPFPSDPFDVRPSILPTDHTTIAHYAPPTQGWPYLLLCRWPPDLTTVAPKDLNMFARAAYTVELFNDHAQLELATERLLALLKRLQRMRIEIVLPDWSAAPGAPPH